MRDLLVVLIFGTGLAYTIQRPFVGIMLFFWISVMNPHRFTWGWAYDLPLAMLAAAATLASCVLHNDELKFPAHRGTWLYILLWVYITLTTVFSFYPVNAWIQWNLVTKILLMTFIAMLLLTTKSRIIALLVGLVAFVGFTGVKGALFGLLTGGDNRIWGPPDSFLYDNNSVGLAMVMIMPIAFSLVPIASKRWHRILLLGVGASSIVCVVLTYSRGALVGLSTVAFFAFLRSRHKIIFGFLAATLVLGALVVLPSHWFDRMQTIEEYEGDRSANMRLNSWHMSYNLARGNLLGGGFDCFTMEQYYKYAPDPELGRVPSGGSTAHSIYFEVMATQGFPGLAIYLACVLSVLVPVFRLSRRLRDSPDRTWVSSLAGGLALSYLGFLSSGAFLSRAFFDLFWILWAIGIALVCLVRDETKAEGAKHAVASGSDGDENRDVTEHSKAAIWEDENRLLR